MADLGVIQWPFSCESSAGAFLLIDWRIKFRDLQCFLEVARQRSVEKADDALSATQATVSKTIRELE